MVGIFVLHIETSEQLHILWFSIEFHTKFLCISGRGDYVIRNCASAHCWYCRLGKFQTLQKYTKQIGRKHKEYLIYKYLSVYVNCAVIIQIAASI